MTPTDAVILALPSKGALADPTINFLQNCGLKVWKPNARQYTGTIPSVPGLDVMFQRVKDIVYKVADGTAALGITGLDVVYEHSDENIIVIKDDLEYGHCRLLVAVPEAWVDVETLLDLKDVALDLREQQHRNLRIATTYTRSARQFLHEQGLHHFNLVKADGAIEAAPTLGYADAVIDLTQTGTTLRENRLKPLNDGVIISSQACLIGNRHALQQNPGLLETLRMVLEYMDASLLGKRYYQLTANIKGESAEAVAQQITVNGVTSGLQGPSIAPVYSKSGGHDWYAATIVISTKSLLPAVEYIRSIGGTQVTVNTMKFAFMECSPTFEKLQETLGVSI